jgi:hypothetical protein
MPTTPPLRQRDGVLDWRRSVRLALWLLSAGGAYYLARVAARLLARRGSRYTASRLHYKRTPRNDAIIAGCPALAEYRAPPFLPGPHLNTLWSAFVRANPGLRYTRRMLDLGDGGNVALDWHAAPRPGVPTLILLHGLTGGSEERYRQWQVKAAAEAGYVWWVASDAQAVPLAASQPAGRAGLRVAILRQARTAD